MIYDRFRTLIITACRKKLLNKNKEIEHIDNGTYDAMEWSWKDNLKLK